jgi:integrase
LSTQVQSDARDNYMTVARCHIIPTLGKKKVSALTVADVQHLTAAKLRGGPDNVPRPLSVSTVRRIRSVLAQALDVCLVEGSLLRNVAKLTKAPKAGQTEGRTLTPAEAKRLLKALEDHRLGLLFIVMLATGLRRGEALGLQWEDVDFRKHTIGVHRQLRRIDGHLVTRAVKGGKSGRTVYLPDQVVTLLKEHRVAQTTHLEAMGMQGTGFLFTTQLGSPLDPRNVHRDFQTVCIKAKLGRWHPHELRHSAASPRRDPLILVIEVGHEPITGAHMCEPYRWLYGLCQKADVFGRQPADIDVCDDLRRIERPRPQPIVDNVVPHLQHQ